MTFTLTVIIPCYNEISTVEKLIKSVRNAPVDKIEIIVVDDGSTDGSLEVLEKLVGSEINVLVKHSNGIFWSS